MADREAVRQASPLEEVIPQLVGDSLHGRGDERTVRCPFHDDHHPSLRVNIEKQLWRCDPCDVGGDVFAFIQRHRDCDFRSALSWLADQADVAENRELSPTQRRSSTPSGTWVYHRPDGSEALKVERFEEGDGKKRFRQSAPDGRGGWICKRGCMADVDRWLYQVHHLHGHETVYLVEGEKAADALVALGLPATTAPGGAGAWCTAPIGLGSYAAQFTKAGVKNVAIFPDNDDAGRRYAEDAARECHAAGLRVKLVPLPGLPPKGDVVDFLAAGGTKADVLKAIADTSRYEPATPAQDTQAGSPAAAPSCSDQSPDPSPLDCEALPTDQVPNPVPMDLACLLSDVEHYVRRYVVLSDHQAAAVTLFIALTHALDAFDCTPYLAITSATPRAGKTRLLEVEELVVARPWLTGRTTAAALVRKVDAEVPTLLLDESDAAFGGEREYAEALRGILNTGYQRSGRMTLCVGQGTNITFRDFSTFAPKAIAGIGKLPSTVADRAIPIELKRKTKGEPVERFRVRTARGVAKPIYAALVTWGGPAVASLRVARPRLPDALNDRAQDVWEPLLAIADLAGGLWPDRARRAAETLMGEVSADDINVELLHDIRTVFDDSNATFIGSTELVSRLAELDSRPWGDWKKGKAITTRAVADRLKAFGIVPRANAQATARGYHRARFEASWTRYPPIKPSTRQYPNETGGETEETTRQYGDASDGSKMQVEPMNTGSTDGLTVCDQDIP